MGTFEHIKDGENSFLAYGNSSFLDGSNLTMNIFNGNDSKQFPFLPPIYNMTNFNNISQNGSVYYDDYEYEPLSYGLQVFSDINHMLDIYVKPVVYLLGMFGNMVSFAVFMFTYMRHISSSIYLAALAISDTGFLLCALLSWTDNLGWFLLHTQVVCQLVVYVSYVTGFLSVWYIVSFTVERCVAIQFPLKRQVMCTPNRAKTVTVVLAIIAALVYTFALWTSDIIHDPYYGMDQGFCQPMPKYYKFVSAINNADTIITLILPTVLIVGSNIHIGYVLAKFYRSRTTVNDSFRLHCRSNRSMSRSPPNTSDNKNVTREFRDSSVIYANTSYNRSQMKVTRMLLLVSTTFLVLNIPFHTLRLVLFYCNIADPYYKPSRTLGLIHELFYFLYYLNFSVNCLLYAVSGRTFRRALKRLCIRIRRNIVYYFQKARATLTKTPFMIQEQPSRRYLEQQPLTRKNTKVEFLNGEKPKILMTPIYD